MSQNVYDVLQERGFIAQTTHEELRELLGKEKVTFYIGFDHGNDAYAESWASSNRFVRWWNNNDR